MATVASMDFRAPRSGRIWAAGETHVGLHRSSNQDAFLVEESLGLFAVADGVASRPGGKRAADLALSATAEFLALAPGGVEVRVTVEQAVRHAARRVQALAEATVTRGCATTLTFAWVRSGSAWIGHAGDSRAYLVRGGEAQRLTCDHNFGEALLENGCLTPDEAARHPARRTLISCLGEHPPERVDVVEVPLRTGDLLVLCTDGVTPHASDAGFAAALRRAAPADVARGLVAFANECGGYDNTTVVAARWTEERLHEVQ